MRALHVNDPQPSAAAEPAAPSGRAGDAAEAGGGAVVASPASGVGPGLPPDAEDGREAPGAQQNRPAAEYVLEPDLARECAAAAAAEGAGGQGAKPQLHLVVLGHVDAGKSTLMGRLLYDLGCAAARDGASPMIRHTWGALLWPSAWKIVLGHVGLAFESTLMCRVLSN